MGATDDPSNSPVLWAVPNAGVSQVSHRDLFNQFSLNGGRWLARNDRWEECHDTLALVHAKGDRHATFIMLELQEIRDMCELERRNSDVSYMELFKPHMINRTHIGVFTQIWSQLTGYDLLCYPCPSLQQTDMYLE